MQRTGMVWYGMVWYGMVWDGMAWYGMVWYGIKLEPNVRRFMFGEMSVYCGEFSLLWGQRGGLNSACTGAKAGGTTGWGFTRCPTVFIII